MGLWHEWELKPVGALHFEIFNESFNEKIVVHDPFEELICQLKQLKVKFSLLKKEVKIIDELISILEEVIDTSLASIWNIARRDVPIPVNAPKELLGKKHEDFILKYGKTDNLFEYVMSEHLRLSGLYWCLTALDLMNKADEADKDLMLNVIEEARNDDGGYGAAKNHASHILHTLCAVQVLVTLNKKELVDVDSIVKFVKNLQQEDGSFNGMPQENDNDTRFAFCSLATLYLLGKLDEVDTGKTVDYVLSCYNFDGGFGTYPKSESHAGQIYCCLGVLALTNNLEKIDSNKTGRWLAERQCPSGRPEKLPDVCYSWWVLASLAILKKEHWIDKETLIQFILGSQDDELGGIADRPGDEMSSPGYNPIHQGFRQKGVVYPSPNFGTYSNYQNQPSSGYCSSSTGSLPSPTDYYSMPNGNYQQNWATDFSAFKNGYGNGFWNEQSGANEEVKEPSQRKRVKMEIKNSHESDGMGTSDSVVRKRNRRYKTPSPQVLRSRRQMANARERRRMDNLNVAYESLREVLPEFDNGRRLSKMETLQMAHLYIQCLGELLQES
ncbi:hypothetical protein FO519_006179 [Halicephalobus sp. NKZ332]|nr:hypothetical protein FO519_006179 [Halicephalobus sp. NKZ332]